MNSMANIGSNLLAPASTLVHIHQGKPVTDSLVIAGEFKRRHDNVLQSLDALIADGTIGRLEFKESSYLSGQNKVQRKVDLTERGALVAMPFIGGRNSRLGQVRLVDAFMALRDESAGRHLVDWSSSRKKVSTSFQDMCDALHEVRAEAGKATAAHHYAAEAKLVNWVLFGRFEAVERDDLQQADLLLMERVEARNTMWIARGRTYDQRKAALPGFLASVRAKPARITQ
ncbi:Rha family transcriptional regulator [Janthinobacterium sp. GB4P2]|uniref:Rha family transcriptional regulator n=1 Tax=Janthinobacterium sp. GB4P2 TaxID=3424189 RepID=UPI003F29154B